MANAPLVICTSVPERADHVEYLRRHLPGLRVIVDKGLGPWSSWMTAWIREPGQARIIVQDDVLLTVDAWRKMSDAVAAFPDHPIQFFDHYADAPPEPGYYAQDGVRWGGSCAYYLPHGTSGPITALAVRLRMDRAFKGGDDDVVREYLRAKGRTFIVVEPSVVDHGLYPSRFPLRRLERRARLFVDPETDGLPDQVAGSFLRPA